MGLAPLVKGIIDRRVALRRDSASTHGGSISSIPPFSPSSPAFAPTPTSTHPLAQQPRISRAASPSYAHPPTTSPHRTSASLSTSFASASAAASVFIKPFRLPLALIPQQHQGYRQLASFSSAGEDNEGESEVEGSPVPHASPVIGGRGAGGVGGGGGQGAEKFVVRDRRRSVERERKKQAAMEAAAAGGEIKMDEKADSPSPSPQSSPSGREAATGEKGLFKFPSPPLGSGEQRDDGAFAGQNDAREKEDGWGGRREDELIRMQDVSKWG